MCTVLQVNRTQLYKSSLTVAANTFAKTLDAVPHDSSDSSTLGDNRPNPFTLSEDGSVFRLSLDQLSGLMALKYGVDAPDASLFASTATKSKAPPTVLLESALDAALYTPRWERSEQRRAILTSSSSVHSAIEDVVSRPSAASLIEADELSKVRSVRLLSMQLPARLDTAYGRPVQLSPVTQRVDISDLKSPSPVRITHRHSGTMCSRFMESTSPTSFLLLIQLLLLRFFC
jgi:hypothetical protein